MQLIDRQYKRKAANNVLRFEVQYAPRGEVVDRNGNYIVQNKECYDLMVVWREMDKAGFDTLKLCNVLGMSKEKMARALKNARMTPRAPYRVKSYVSQESKLRFDEHNYMGFYTIKRTVRQYPRNIGGNLLGNLGEVNDRDIKQGGGEYKLGDYIGRSGLERAYEEYLRGEQELFLTRAAEVYGTRGQQQAQAFLDSTRAMFAGGDLSPEDIDMIGKHFMEMFWEAKENAKKYTPAKYKGAAGEGSAAQNGVDL
jgi:hypothetical protein